MKKLQDSSKDLLTKRYLLLLIHGFYLFTGFIMLFAFPQDFGNLLLFMAASYLINIFILYKTSYFKDIKQQLEVLELQHKNLNQQLHSSNEEIWELTKKQQELLLLNSSLRELATTDELTHLLNKRSFDDAFVAELSRAARNGQTFTLAFIEINHFLMFNENNHRKNGEELIKIIANILRDTLRLTDVISRYEWDLFALVLTEADLDLANIIIQRIKKAVEKYPFDGREVLPEQKVTFSVGVANYPLDGYTMADLVEKAEKTLQESRLQDNFNNLKYFSLYRELLRENTDNHHQIANEVKALLTLIDKKDQYTVRHSEQVVKYSLAIAERLKLDKHEVNKLKLAAILHDIGKIEIDSEILNKSEPLTKEEYDLVKRHSVKGANLINTFQGLKDIVPLVKYHHENYDGSGYPTGLKGEEIPLSARILALADSFDAMLNKRPYRRNLPIQQALKEINQLSGKKYDPKLVKHFQEIMEDQLKNEVS